MNLDLLKKLVKLANNNPNENEANSAARRVCKMIEEADFNFSHVNSGVAFTSLNELYSEILRRTGAGNVRREESRQQDVRTPTKEEYERKQSYYDPYYNFVNARYRKIKNWKCPKCGRIVNILNHASESEDYCWACFKGF